MKSNNFPKHTESFWHRTSSVAKYPKLDKDISVDVAVIGGGIAGILAAYELASRGKNVALLEARKFLYGTTGFTTSKLTAQHGLIYHSLIERYGEEKARQYYQANIEGIELVKEISEKHGIECELRQKDSYVYTEYKSKVKDLEEEAKAYKSLSIDGELVESLPIDLDIESAIVMHKQYEFHPVMFLGGLLKELEKMGVAIFEHTMVTEVEDGEKVTLKTEDGNTITCGGAICASHYPVDDPDKYYAENLEPSITFATTYKYEEDLDGMFLNTCDPGRTFRLVGKDEDKYILVGGEDHTLGDGTSDLDRYKSIVDFAKKTFHVKDVVSRWSSHDYMTEDNLPFIGLTSPDRQNVYVVTGLNKWGLSNGAISSKILADAIEGKENQYMELFDPHREIPELEKQEEGSEEDSKEKRRTSTPKKDVKALEKEEALVYTKDNEKIGAFKDKEGVVHHLSLKCTHLGCDLGWNDGDMTWDCPCHGSRFNSTGEVIEGPAMEDLEKVDTD